MTGSGRLATIANCPKPDKIPEADMAEANNRPIPDRQVSPDRPLDTGHSIE